MTFGAQKCHFVPKSCQVWWSEVTLETQSQKWYLAVFYCVAFCACLSPRIGRMPTLWVRWDQFQWKSLINGERINVPERESHVNFVLSSSSVECVGDTVQSLSDVYSLECCWLYCLSWSVIMSSEICCRVGVYLPVAVLLILLLYPARHTIQDSATIHTYFQELVWLWCSVRLGRCQRKCSSKQLVYVTQCSCVSSHLICVLWKPLQTF